MAHGPLQAATCVVAGGFVAADGGTAAAFDPSADGGTSLDRPMPSSDGTVVAGPALLSAAAARLLALVERQLAAADPPSCAGCGGAALYRWGRLGESGGQRWRCRACGRTFTARTGTLLAGRRAPEKLRCIVLDMFAAKPRSCRQLAAELGLDKSTVWSWRRQLSDLLLAAGRDSASGPAALVEIVRESRKASREWVNHRHDPHRFPAPDRFRWIDYVQQMLPLPDPMTPYLIAVRLDRGVQTTRSANDAPAGPIGAETKRRAQGSASVPTGSRPAVDRPACGDAIVTAFRRFIGAFRGPASRYLDGYVAWFAARFWSPAT